MSEIGSRIALARKNSDLTQDALGEALVPPVSAQAVSQWERGDTSPRNGRITQIAKLVNVSRFWLLTGEGEPSDGQIAQEPEQRSSVASVMASIEHLSKLPGGPDVIDLIDVMVKRAIEVSQKSPKISDQGAVNGS